MGRRRKTLQPGCREIPQRRDRSGRGLLVGSSAIQEGQRPSRAGEAGHGTQAKVSEQSLEQKRGSVGGLGTSAPRDETAQRKITAIAESGVFWRSHSFA